jgi:hypothetical protein
MGAGLELLARALPLAFPRALTVEPEAVDVAADSAAVGNTAAVGRTGDSTGAV